MISACSSPTCARRRASAAAIRKVSDTARRKGNFSEQVVFFLVKQARVPRLLHGDVIRARAHRDTDARVGQLFEKYFEQGGKPQLQLTGPVE
jgi:hypothetical protein